jgi:hypothetical protein
LFRFWLIAFQHTEKNMLVNIVLLQKWLLRCGGNDYRIRHIGKSRMLNEGTLPTRIEASEDALDTFRIVMGDPAVANAGGDDDAQGDNDAADNNNNLQMI